MRALEAHAPRWRRAGWREDPAASRVTRRRFCTPPVVSTAQTFVSSGKTVDGFGSGADGREFAPSGGQRASSEYAIMEIEPKAYPSTSVARGRPAAAPRPAM